MGRQKKTKHNDARRVLKASKLSIFGLGSLLGTSLLLIMLACPVTPPKVDAAEGEGVTMTSNLSTKTTAYLYSMISLSLSDSIDIDLTPNSTGSLGIGSAKVKVSTNNTTGYSLYLATVDQTNELKQVDESLAYSNATSDTSYSIKPLTTNTTASNYLASTANLNTWGYALTDPSGGTAETVYTGLMNPTSTNIHSVSATSSNDEYKLNIAVAADASLPAGAYQNGLIVSAVANPIALSGFNQIYYMQEMTPEICASAKEHEEGQLVDKRDNTIYWVAKLKDGNCWMTQNLDLDLSPDIALTPEDSNVTEAWRPEVGTTTEVYHIEDTMDYGQAPQASYNPGKFVVRQPNDNETTSCRDSSPSQCPSKFINVSDHSAAFTATADSTTDEANKTYDSHYLIGNFYAYNSVVAGKADPGLSYKEYESDICPRGWKVARGSRYPQNLDLFRDNNDYYNLFSIYGYDSDYARNASWANFVYTTITTEQRLATAMSPLYLFGSGNVTRRSNSNGGLGMKFDGYQATRFWTSVQYGKGVAANMQSNAFGYLYPGTSGDYLFLGMNVRCMAKSDTLGN